MVINTNVVHIVVNTNYCQNLELIHKAIRVGVMNVIKHMHVKNIMVIANHL